MFLLIERVSFDTSGRVARVMWFRHRQWQRQEPAVEASVAAVIAAIQQGEEVKVLIGGVIGGRVTASPDGSTIVDVAIPERAALSLKDVQTY